MHRRSLIAALVISMMAGPWGVVPAWSKNTSLSRVHTHAGTLAWVLLKTDEQLLVRIVDATDSELMVTVTGAPRTIGVREIARVFIDGDSVKDGALIGAAIGAPVAILGSGGGPSGSVPGFALAAALFYGGIGALVDWRHHGQTELYRAPGS